MRAPFNTTCQIYAGPGTGTPGLSRGIFDCRHVPEHGIHSEQIDPGQPRIPSYLTIQGYRPRGIFVPPKYSLDISQADVVAIPFSAIPQYLVFYTDWIRWRGQAKYYRSYLIDLGDNPIGGVVLNGAAIIQSPDSDTGGGVVCGGSTMPILLTFPGGAVLGGGGIIVPGKPYITSGGLLVGGIAYVVPGSSYKPIGGVVIGGAGKIIPGKPITGIGGVVMGGIAHVVPSSVYKPVGGLLLGGLADVIPGKAAAYVGGVLLGGQGSFDFGLPRGVGLFLNIITPTPRIWCGTGQILPFSIAGRSVVISGCVNNAFVNGTWTIEFVDGTQTQFALLGSNGIGQPLGSEPAALWHVI